MNAWRPRYAYRAAAGAFALSAPACSSVVYAQVLGLTYFNTLIVWFDYLFSITFSLVIAVATLSFFWGMAKFIRASGDDKAISEGKQQMLWSVVALFVMVSIWGIVGFMGTVFGVGQGGDISPPGIADEPDELLQQ